MPKAEIDRKRIVLSFVRSYLVISVCREADRIRILQQP